MNLTYDMEATWETKKNERLPKRIDVTVDFVYIGAEQIGKNKDKEKYFGFDAKAWNK